MPNFSDIALDEWITQYKPKIRPTGSFFYYDEGNDLKHIQHLLATNPRCVWTLQTDEEGGTMLTSGYHYIDRLGFYVTEVAAPDNEDIQIDTTEHDVDAVLYGDSHARG